jgi:hypothetical protein
MIIYSISFIYFFADPVLCLDETTGTSETREVSWVKEVSQETSQQSLDDTEISRKLKNILSEETIKYNEAMKELDDLMNKMDKAEQDKNYSLANHYDFESECKADDICDILLKIRDIEEKIKEKDFSFESSIDTPDFAK